MCQRSFPINCNSFMIRLSQIKDSKLVLIHHKKSIQQPIYPIMPHQTPAPQCTTPQQMAAPALYCLLDGWIACCYLDEMLLHGNSFTAYLQLFLFSNLCYTSLQHNTVTSQTIACDIKLLHFC